MHSVDQTVLVNNKCFLSFGFVNLKDYLIFYYFLKVKRDISRSNQFFFSTNQFFSCGKLNAQYFELTTFQSGFKMHVLVKLAKTLKLQLNMKKEF